LIRSRLGEKEEARQELDVYTRTLQHEKRKAWPECIGRYLTGNLAEGQFLTQATATAQRQTDVNEQVCGAFYYAAMRHLLDGDKSRASELFQKCLDTDDRNSFERMSAGAELQSLKQQ
jgi:lipoprotein NlpI